MNPQSPDAAPPDPAKPFTVVYACSGGSDAGELADRIARQLTREGGAQMACLAGIGGQVNNLVAKAESAPCILVIDGCPLACGQRTLERAGFNRFAHLGPHDLGFRKGSCGVAEATISVGVTAAMKIILRSDVSLKRNDSIQ
ncbi:MAG: putative zinc-binding protein [Verrucomicrobiota bacterium]|nr:putative zinc-binding protein [Limisphaerales bacterium]